MLRMSTCAGLWCFVQFSSLRLFAVAICSITGSSTSIVKVAAANLLVLLCKHDLSPHQIKDERVRTGPPAFTWCSWGSNSRIWICLPFCYQHSDPVDLDFVPITMFIFTPHLLIVLPSAQQSTVHLHHLQQFLVLRSSVSLSSGQMSSSRRGTSKKLPVGRCGGGGGGKGESFKYFHSRSEHPRLRLITSSSDWASLHLWGSLL